MPPRHGIGGLTCCGFLIRMRQTNSPDVAPGKRESLPLLLNAEVVSGPYADSTSLLKRLATG